MIQTKVMEKYFFFSLLFITLLFTFMIFKPFLPLIIISACFAVILFPLYQWLKKIKFPDWLAALISIIFFLTLICGPLLFIGFLVFNQSQELYLTFANHSDNTIDFLKNIEISINNYLPTGIVFNLNQKISDFISFLSQNIATIFTSTLTTIFYFFLMLVSLFFFLKDGTAWRKALILLSPLSDADDEKIISKLSMSINGIIKGYLLIALIQGFLMGLGLAFAGVPNSALWGVVAGIGSLIPTIGTALVSVPAVIFLFLSGHTPEAIGMSIWAFLIVGWIDNLLNPIIIASKIEIPQILVLFSLLGGLSLLGPLGFLIGPLTVSLLYALISIYKNEFKETKTENP